MMKKKPVRKPALGPLQNVVMQVLWDSPGLTAEGVRKVLAGSHDLKDSTVRTVLRRLEDKGYVEHDLDGRTYVYRPRVAQQNVASDAVRGIIDKFCSGSVEDLLVGLVDDKVITPSKLRELADRIAEAEKSQLAKKKRSKK